jgi:hypothetical protein
MMSLLASLVLLAAPPQMAVGDLTHGEALIAAHCGGCDSTKLHDPALLSQTGEAALRRALVGGRGIGPLKGWDGTRLHQLDSWDVSAYLRHHGVALTTLVPAATHFAVFERTPNQWGRERLAKKAGLFGRKTPSEAQATGQIIVTWTRAGSSGLSNVTGDQSMIGDFTAEERGNYVLFGTAKKVFFGLVVDKGDLRVRRAKAVPTAGGAISRSHLSVGRGCKGKGRRDNYRRFACGGGLAKAIFKRYITGAEQIYAQELHERENDFDF